MIAVEQHAGREEHPLDRLAARVRNVPGVVDLYGGISGEIGTHLPGRRIAGLRTRGDRTEVSVIAEFGQDLADLAERVRSAVAAETAGIVDVSIGDVMTEDDVAVKAESGSDSSAHPDSSEQPYSSHRLDASQRPDSSAHAGTSTPDPAAPSPADMPSDGVLTEGDHVVRP